MYDEAMSYTFSPSKNLKLKQERGISFEEIVAAIDNGQLLNVMEHPNSKKYAGQRIYVVYANDYVYLVPFVADEENNIFLKTIIPSRKACQQYLGGKDEKKIKLPHKKTR